MRAELRGSFHLDGQAVLLDEVVLEVRAVVINMGVVPVDVSTYGEDREEEWLPGDTLAALKMKDAFRIVGGSHYDPRVKETELQKEIDSLKRRMHSQEAEIRGLKRKNPEGANVPALQATLTLLRAEYDTLADKHRILIHGED